MLSPQHSVLYSYFIKKTERSETTILGILGINL